MGDRLNGKIAVITGAASGIGAASARRFVEEGATVVVADVQTDLGQAVAAELGDAARFVECDVTDEHAVAAAIQSAIDTWGRIDVMFNNAGVIGAIGPIAETPTDAWRPQHRHPAQLGLLRLQARRPGDGAAGLGLDHQHVEHRRRRSEVSAGTPTPTAKTAVVGLTKSVASELGPKGVRCNAIAPGTVPTALTAAMLGDVNDLDAVAEQSRERYGRSSDAIDIANAALYLASDEAGLRQRPHVGGRLRPQHQRRLGPLLQRRPGDGRHRPRLRFRPHSRRSLRSLAPFGRTR